MYLAMLNETQKKLFLEFAHTLASIDGNISEQEHQMLKEYCAEMRIEYQADITVKSMDEIIDLIEKEFSDLEKRIMVFEAIGLAMVDSNYDESERKMIADLAKIFGIRNGFDKDCENILKEYIGIQCRMNEIVLD